MKYSLSVLLLLCTTLVSAQKATYVFKSPADSSYNCYLKISPNEGKIKGLVIRDYSRLPNISRKSKYQFTDLAIEKGLMVVYTCSSNYFPELCYTDTPLILLDEMIHDIVQEHNIDPGNIFIGGISASGTRALQYTKYCEQGKSKHKTKIRGVFAVDSPLDFERFYYSAKNNGNQFKGGMLSEAKMMVPIFEKRLKGSPKNNMTYQDRSVYTQFAKGGGNARFFKKVSTIIFHEPDLDWWKQERNASYYDINSFDNVAFVNQLKVYGNQDVTLITTSGKGYQNGVRKCHSWSIVDEVFLVEWILNRIQ